MWSVDDFDVRNGETKRVDCPACKGRKTFTITNNMGSLMWNCYKATCDVSGRKRVRLSTEDIKKSFAPPEDTSKEIDWELPKQLVYQPSYTQKFVDQ